MSDDQWVPITFLREQPPKGGLTDVHDDAGCVVVRVDPLHLRERGAARLAETIADNLAAGHWRKFAPGAPIDENIWILPTIAFVPERVAGGLVVAILDDEYHIRVVIDPDEISDEAARELTQKVAAHMSDAGWRRRRDG